MKNNGHSKEKGGLDKINPAFLCWFQLITLLISFIHSVSFAILKEPLGFVSLALFGVTLLNLIFLKKKKETFYSFLLWVVSYTGFYSFLIYKTGGMGSTLLPWILFIPFFLAFLQRPKFWSISLLVVLSILFFIKGGGSSVVDFPSFNQGLFGGLNFLLVLLVPCFVGLQFIKEKDRELFNLSQNFFSDPKVLTSFNASKMATLSEMAGGVSHEVNNPLTIIVGQVYALKKFMKNSDLKKDENDFIEDVMEKLKVYSTKISKIIKELRNFAKDGSNDPFEEVSVKTILTASLDLYAEKLKNYGFKVTIDCPDDLMVTGRKIELQQSFAHLVTNSFEYGKIGETSWMTINVSQESEEKIKILFTDSGPGIDKGMKDKIFEPFFSTRLPQKTGLGLSIARSILEAHEGTISLVEDSENTSFEIILSQSLKEGAP